MREHFERRQTTQWRCTQVMSINDNDGSWWKLHDGHCSRCRHHHHVRYNCLLITPAQRWCSAQWSYYYIESNMYCIFCAATAFLWLQWRGNNRRQTASATWCFTERALVTNLNVWLVWDYIDWLFFNLCLQVNQSDTRSGANSSTNRGTWRWNWSSQASLRVNLETS